MNDQERLAAMQGDILIDRAKGCLGYLGYAATKLTVLGETGAGLYQLYEAGVTHDPSKLGGMALSFGIALLINTGARPLLRWGRAAYGRAAAMTSEAHKIQVGLIDTGPQTVIKIEDYR